jgi:outer membrane lipoprotein SlyB
LSGQPRASHALIAATALALTGCAASPLPTTAAPPEVFQPPAATQVFVYASGGQTPAQLDRDRYECHLWAVRQSRYDPSLPDLAPHQRVEVVAMPPPGTSTLAGAATGAIIGAAVSSPYHSGDGAAVGAVAGAMLGAVADSARAQEANRINQANRAQDMRLLALREEQATAYRRAVSACLEGRGYTVK